MSFFKVLTYFPTKTFLLFVLLSIPFPQALGGRHSHGHQLQRDPGHTMRLMITSQKTNKMRIFLIAEQRSDTGCLRKPAYWEKQRNRSSSEPPKHDISNGTLAK